MDAPAIAPVLMAGGLLAAAQGMKAHRRYASIIRASEARQQMEGAAPRRLRFSPTLAMMWGLFLACNGILLTQDPLYAVALLMTAASSCKLRRVFRYAGNAGFRPQEPV